MTGQAVPQPAETPPASQPAETPPASPWARDVPRRLAVKPSVIVLVIYSIGQWIGRRRWVQAFLIGLEDGALERTYHNVYGEWPKQHLTKQQAVAIMQAAVEAVKREAPAP